MSGNKRNLCLTDAVQEVEWLICGHVVWCIINEAPPKCSVKCRGNVAPALGDYIIIIVIIRVVNLHANPYANVVISACYIWRSICLPIGTYRITL